MALLPYLLVTLEYFAFFPHKTIPGCISLCQKSMSFPEPRSNSRIFPSLCQPWYCFKIRLLLSTPPHPNCQHPSIRSVGSVKLTQCRIKDKANHKFLTFILYGGKRQGTGEDGRGIGMGYLLNASDVGTEEL